MVTMLDHDYWDFTAEVTTAAVDVGDAVMFVSRYDGNSIPLVTLATADNNVTDDDPRTTYVGVAMVAGAVGDQISVRCWAAGTMPARVTAVAEIQPGDPLYWNGSVFAATVQGDMKHTAIAMTYIPVSSHAICEILVLKGDRL